ncbi:hypothetical protein FOZ63_022711, partial [Perkinsus olseni]
MAHNPEDPRNRCGLWELDMATLQWRKILCLPIEDVDDLPEDGFDVTVASMGFLRNFSSGMVTNRRDRLSGMKLTVTGATLTDVIGHPLIQPCEDLAGELECFLTVTQPITSVGYGPKLSPYSCCLMVRGTFNLALDLRACERVFQRMGHRLADPRYLTAQFFG